MAAQLTSRPISMAPHASLSFPSTSSVRTSAAHAFRAHSVAPRSRTPLAARRRASSLQVKALLNVTEDTFEAEVLQVRLY